MSSTSHVHDIERQADLHVFAFPEAYKNMPGMQDLAGQGCFPCLESPGQGQYTILVPCLRPTKARLVVEHSMIFTENEKPIYEQIMPWDNACESDNDIYRRLVDTCYQHLGRWKRWLPYYGVTDVVEVTVQLNASC